MPPLYTAKRCCKNHERVVMKLKKGALISAGKCTKTFGGLAPPGPAGEAYSAPPNPLAGLKG